MTSRDFPLSVAPCLSLLVSRGQTANFFTGRYRLLILQAITPCKKISGLATRDYQPPGLHRNNRRTDSVASTCVNYCTCSYINLTNAPLHVICRRRHIDLVRHHINLVGLNTIYIYVYNIYTFYSRYAYI